MVLEVLIITVFILSATSMSKLQCTQTNLEQDSEAIHHEFKHFLGTLITAMNDKRDQEELSIMNNR